MQHERIGLDHIYRAPALGEAVTIVELHRAQIGKQEDVGSNIAHLIRALPLGVFDGRSLGSHAHGHASRLGGDGQILVDALGHLGPTSHGRDDKGDVQRPSP